MKIVFDRVKGITGARKRCFQECICVLFKKKNSKAYFLIEMLNTELFHIQVSNLYIGIDNNRNLTETLDAMTEIGLTQENQDNIMKVAHF